MNLHFVLDYDGNINTLSELGTHDLSFEINPNFLNELMMSSSPTSNNAEAGSNTGTNVGGMDVDQDIAGWLDSMLPNPSPQNQTNTVRNDSGISEMNGNTDTMFAGNSTINANNPGNSLVDSGANAVNNNIQQANQTNVLGLMEAQNDSLFEDSDMIMQTLQSPLSIHQNFWNATRKFSPNV